MTLLLLHNRALVEQVVRWSLGLFALGLLIMAIQVAQVLKAHGSEVSSPSDIGKVDSIEQGRQQAMDQAKREGKTTYSFTTGKMPPPMEGH